MHDFAGRIGASSRTETSSCKRWIGFTPPLRLISPAPGMARGSAPAHSRLGEHRAFHAEQDARSRRRDARPNTNAGLGLVVMCWAKRGCFTSTRVTPTRPLPPRQHRCGRESPPRQRATVSRDCSVFVRCTAVRRCAPAAALPVRAIVSAGVLPPRVVVGVTLTVQRGRVNAGMISVENRRTVCLVDSPP